MNMHTTKGPSALTTQGDVVSEPRPPRVLQLAQYPIKTPSHGGQVRSRAIADALRRCGCIVESIGVYPDFAFPPEQRSGMDVVIASTEFNEAYFAEPLFGDLTITSFLLARAALLEMAVTRIASFSPDLIFLEQPFLFPLIDAARRAGVRTKLLYSSHNDEALLKRILVKLERGPGSSDHGLIETVAALESDCIAAADCVISINDDEAAQLRAKGVPATHLNASSPFDFETAAAAAKPAASKKDRYVAYAASSYWLNVEGYFEIFADGLGFLAPDEKVEILGGGGDAIQKDARFDRHRSINESRCAFRGFLPSDKLIETYLGAEALIIPVTQGAGSNLKTADALAAGRPVISTPKGLAGYRSLLGDAMGAGVYEAETPQAFKALVRDALRGKLRAPSPAVSRRFRRERTPALLREIMQAAGLLAPAAHP
jgi:glycosyltransferase involved in cell wall biosynthesis